MRGIEVCRLCRYQAGMVTAKRVCSSRLFTTFSHSTTSFSLRAAPVRKVNISHNRYYSEAISKGSDVSIRKGPLDGVRVVDLSRVLAGPLCTMMLGDLGADVVKIESPGKGDDTRSWSPPSAPSKEDDPRPDLPPESAYFLQVNRNKRSLTVNLKSEEGKAIVLDLVKQGDVFVENYLPGKLKSFGLDYESLKKIKPSLIYCSISGYGPKGPSASKPGYDAVIQAEAGLMHITGEPDGPPTKVGVAVIDVLTGHYAQSAILAALYARKETGEGCKIDCSLFESAVASLANIGSNWLIAGKEAKRLGSGHPSIVPYQPFPTANSSEPLMFAVGNDNQFKTLCGVLGHPEWAQDPRYRTNQARVKHRDVLIEMMESVLTKSPRSEWVEKLEGKGVPFAPINNIQQTYEHPQTVALGMIQEVEHSRAGKIKLAAPAVTFDGMKASATRPPPYLGEHTLEVLQELGYDDQKIAALMKNGAS